MKSTANKYILVVILLSLTTISSFSQLGDLNIDICNKGDIPVYVAMAKIGGIWNDIEIEGWVKVEARSYGCATFHRGSTSWNYYFAFAIKDKNGKLGIAGYRPSRNDNGHKQSSYYFAASNDKFKKKGNAESLQRTGKSEILVPFTWGIEYPKGFSLDNYNFTIRIEPSDTDPIIAYFDDKKNVEVKREVVKEPNKQGTDAGKKEAAPSSVEKENIPDTKHIINRDKLARKCFDHHNETSELDPAELAAWSNCVADKIISSTELTNRDKNDLQQNGFGANLINIKGGSQIMNKIYESCK